VNATDKVLALLYDRAEGYFALDELAAGAGVRRQRLEGLLEDLRRAGQRLEASPASGVRLVRPAGLSAHLIERRLGTRRVGVHAICFNEVDSTNDVAFDSARQAGSDGLAVLAESQRRGRGRMGRRWVSPPRANLLMSVLLVDPRAALPQEALTIASGLAVAEGAEAAAGCPCRLKWPNDVLLGEAKVAGVLVEVRRVGGGRCVVVGAGVNVNAAPPPDEVGAPAACLTEHVGGPVERIEVARAVLQRLDRWVGRLAGARAGEAAALVELRTAWLARCDMINRRVVVASAGRHHVGRVMDVSPLEGLILSDDAGRRIHVPAEGATVLG